MMDTIRWPVRPASIPVDQHTVRRRLLADYLVRELIGILFSMVSADRLAVLDYLKSRICFRCGDGFPQRSKSEASQCDCPKAPETPP